VALRETLAQLAGTVDVGEVDCSKQASLCTEHGVVGYPALVLYRQGQYIAKHSGKRDAAAIRTWLTRVDPQKPDL
jgi:thioredoxin-like negative regulator of GroEL